MAMIDPKHCMVHFVLVLCAQELCQVEKCEFSFHPAIET